MMGISYNSSVSLFEAQRFPLMQPLLYSIGLTALVYLDLFSAGVNHYFNNVCPSEITSPFTGKKTENNTLKKPIKWF